MNEMDPLRSGPSASRTGMARALLEVVYRLYVVLFLILLTLLVVGSALKEVWLLASIQQEGLITYWMAARQAPSQQGTVAVPPFPGVSWEEFCGTLILLVAFALPIIIRFIAAPTGVGSVVVRSRWRCHGLTILLAAGACLVAFVAAGNIVRAVTGERIHARQWLTDRYSVDPGEGRSGRSQAGRADELGVREGGSREVAPLPVPGFSASTLSGAKVQRSDYDGKILLLEFWASWCQPCVKSLPVLAELQAEFGQDPRFAIVTVCLDRDRDVAQRAIEQFGIPGVHLFEDGAGWNNSVARAFRVASIPHTELILGGSRARVVHLASGRTEKLIREALAELGTIATEP